MQKKNQTDSPKGQHNNIPLRYRKLKNLERQIRQLARQVDRCWTLLNQSSSYIAPPMELVIKVSKM